MSPPAVELRGMRHAYGDKVVLDALDWRVEGPGVFGFLGVNGAGKTTLLRVLSGAIRASGGQVSVLGRPPEDPSLRGRVSAVHHSSGLYPWMTAEEHLLLIGELHGLSRAEARKQADALLDRVELTDSRGARAETLAWGRKRRLELAMALLGGPELILLDEPLSGQDPVGIRLFLELLASVGREATVLFSTHVLGDVARVCDRVAVLHQGRIAAFDTPERLVADAGPPTWELELDGDPAPLLAAISKAGWASVVPGEGPLRLQVQDELRARRALPALVAQLGLGLVALRPLKPTLESAFLRVIGRAP